MFAACRSRAMAIAATSAAVPAQRTHLSARRALFFRLQSVRLTRSIPPVPIQIDRDAYLNMRRDADADGTEVVSNIAEQARLQLKDSNNLAASDLLATAQELIAKREFSLALECLDRVRSPVAELRAAANLHRAQCLFYLDRVDESLQACNAELARDPNIHLLRHVRGRAYFARGEFSKAVADFIHFIDYCRPSKFSSDSEFHNVLKDVLLMRASARLELNEPEGCLADCDQLLLLEPDHLDGHFSRGSALLALGRPEDALASFEAVLRSDPQDVRALYGRSLARSDMGDIADAVSDISSCIETQPENFNFRLHRAYLLGKCRRDWQGALREYETLEQMLTPAGRRNSESVPQPPSEEQLQLQQHRAQEFQVLTGKANCLMALRRHKDAFDALSGVVEIAPQFSRAWNNRGLCALWMGNPSAAEESFKAALLAEPGLDTAVLNYSHCLDRQNHFADALAVFSEFERRQRRQEDNTAYRYR